MSLPVMHTAAGYVVSRIGARGRSSFDIVSAVICMILGNAPDLDFIPGVLFGEAAKYHRGVTHSFAAALFTAAIVSLCVLLWRKRDFFINTAIFFSAYSTHIFLDWFGSGPKGVYVFWPFIDKPFFGPFADPGADPVHPLDTAGGLSEFFQALATRDCAAALCSEFAVVFIVWTLWTAGTGSRSREHFPLVFIRCTAALLFLGAAMAAHTHG